MAVPLLIPLIAVAAAVGIGYAVSSGLVSDHMGPTDGRAGPIAVAPDCIETLDKLPSGSSDIDNLRNAAKKAYLTAASPADAMFLKTFASELDAQGFHDAATCMRGRAASIEASMSIIPKPGAPLPSYLTGGPALGSPYVEGSSSAGLAPSGASVASFPV